MNIAVQAADLDASRIDGTRVYLLRLLERFGTIAPEHSWRLYHRAPWNPALAPPVFPDYTERRIPFPFFWTQTRFALELFRTRPERLFMPVQTLPFVLPAATRPVITIHDLAFKIFPEHFPARDRRRLDWFTDIAVRKAWRLIAVSHSTKRDILRFYPDTPPDKIRVIHHGFDAPRNSDDGETRSGETPPFLRSHRLSPENYLLAVGAIQPRKNLLRLLDAFERIAPNFPDMKLVLAGEAAWMSEPVFRAREEHPFRDRIVLTGRLSFEERSTLYRNARLFVFPSLYEGFGLPLLEAFSAGIPAIAARNSSLVEVGGDAARFFETENVDSLAEAIRSLWENSEQQNTLVERGRERLKDFSWDTCARETAEWILGEGE